MVRENRENSERVVSSHASVIQQEKVGDLASGQATSHLLERPQIEPL